MIKVYRKN